MAWISVLEHHVQINYVMSIMIMDSTPIDTLLKRLTLMFLIQIENPLWDALRQINSYRILSRLLTEWLQYSAMPMVGTALCWIRGDMLYDLILVQIDDKLAPTINCEKLILLIKIKLRWLLYRPVQSWFYIIRQKIIFYETHNSNCSRSYISSATKLI